AINISYNNIRSPPQLAVGTEPLPPLPNFEHADLVSGSRHARKSLGEGEAGLAARGPFHWASQLVSASRLVCCAQVPESGDESGRGDTRQPLRHPGDLRGS